jgi:hypothetical protein
VTATAPTPPTLSVAHLLSAPLSQLLTETGARLVDSSIRDREFLGAVTQHRRDGQINIVLPAGRSRRERDTMARYLLGKLLGADITDLPGATTTMQAVA